MDKIKWLFLFSNLVNIPFLFFTFIRKTRERFSRCPQLSDIYGSAGDGDMNAAKRQFPKLHTTLMRHLASISLFAYNFSMDGPMLIKRT